MVNRLAPEDRPPPPPRRAFSRNLVVAFVVLDALMLIVIVWGLSAHRGPTGLYRESEGRATSQPPAAQSSAEPSDLEVTVGVARADPMESIPLSGHLDGSPPGAVLRVQLRDDSGRWVTFPLRPAVDASGSFSTYVELGERGVHELRVLEPSSGLTSQTLAVRVR